MMQRQHGFVWFSDKHDSVKEILWFGLQSVSYNVYFNRLLFVAMVINMWLKLWSRWWSFFRKKCGLRNWKLAVFSGFRHDSYSHI